GGSLEQGYADLVARQADQRGGDFHLCVDVVRQALSRGKGLIERRHVVADAAAAVLGIPGFAVVFAHESRSFWSSRSGLTMPGSVRRSKGIVHCNISL